VKYIVGVADMRVSADGGDRMVTHALGSCLGIAVHDPVKAVGGLLHVMLPLSTIDASKAEDNPFMFVDTGVPRLFVECYRLGAAKERMKVYVAGGASTPRGERGEDQFQIGRRNMVMLRKLLWKNGVLIQSEDVGGHQSRTMELDIGTGEVLIRRDGSVSAM
jgi:chemotaxis protein CheD